MNNFLENHHYIFLDSRMPNSDEWANNPFSQDSGLSKNLFRLMFSYSVTNFTLITAKNQELITEFWMSVKTTPFRKPIVTFRQGTSYENTDKYIYKDIKIVQVIDSCPACGFKLNNQDIECPDCGLSFK